MRIDLHAHTNASDGEHGPRELVGLAVAARLDVLGVTDHDTIASLGEAMAEGAAAGIRVVPGIEMSAQEDGADLHILGYFVDPAAPGFAAFLETLREGRRERVVRIVEILNRAGVPITAEEVFATARGVTVSRSHVAHVLQRRGLATSRSDAFRKYLGKRGVAYVPGARLRPREAIGRIADAGGVSILAHPGWLEDDGVIPSLVAAGLDGIETWYPDARPSETERFLGIAARYRLLPSGGSDYHGEHAHGRSLGTICCPEDAFQKIEARHQERLRGRAADPANSKQ